MSNELRIFRFEYLSRKRTSENSFSTSSIRFQRSTNATSPYLSNRTDNKFKHNTPNGVSRISPLSNIHSKPLHNNLRLWNDDDDDGLYEWREPSCSAKSIDNCSSSTDVSSSKSISGNTNLRKKGLTIRIIFAYLSLLVIFIFFSRYSLKNIGATCYMNSILQCLLNIDPFRYDLMLTNSELITSSLLGENTIYM